MRSFIEGHPAYRGDGEVPQEVSDALLDTCDKIGENPPMGYCV